VTVFFNLVLSGLLIGGVYGMVALGFVVAYKCSRVINIAYGQFAMLGAYVAWTFMGSDISPRLPVGLALFLTFVFAVVFGLVVERVFFRRLLGYELHIGFMLTLGLMGLLDGVTMFTWGFAPQSLVSFLPGGPVHLGSIVLNKQYITSFFVAMVFLGCFLYFFRRTKLGLAMRAAAENQPVAQSLGVSIALNSQVAWVLCSLIATMGGILLATALGVSPGLSGLVMVALAICILGGLDSVGGAIAAGLLLGVASNLASYYGGRLVSGIDTIVPALLIFLTLAIRPFGLFGSRPVERI
jgi:branched-chain amino acid transport system permease protein